MKKMITKSSNPFTMTTIAVKVAEDELYANSGQSEATRCDPSTSIRPMVCEQRTIPRKLYALDRRMVQQRSG